MIGSEEWTFLESPGPYLHTGKVLANNYITVSSGGRNLRVTKRSAGCDLLHQVVQKAEYERDTTSVSIQLVLGSVYHQRF